MLDCLQGMVVVIRFEGPQGGPGMPEMLTPTSAIMGAGLGKVCIVHYAVMILLYTRKGNIINANTFGRRTWRSSPMVDSLVVHTDSSLAMSPLRLR